MTAIDTQHDYAADVRAAFERLLAEVMAERDTLARSLAATRAELTALRELVAELDGSASADREHDARSAEVEAVDAELPGRLPYVVLP